MEHRLGSLFGVWVLVWVLGKLIAIADEAARGHIQGSALHLVEQIWPHDFAGAAHDFVHALVDDLRLVDGDAGLSLDAVLELILRLVIEWARFARPPLNNLEVLLKATTP